MIKKEFRIMKTLVKLFSNKDGEIIRFLNNLYIGTNNVNNYNNNNLDILEWEIFYENPIEIADIIGVFIENKENYEINMWISLDKDVLINITDYNADKIIRYLYERYPY